MSLRISWLCQLSSCDTFVQIPPSTTTGTACLAVGLPLDDDIGGEEVNLDRSDCGRRSRKWSKSQLRTIQSSMLSRRSAEEQAPTEEPKNHRPRRRRPYVLSSISTCTASSEGQSPQSGGGDSFASTTHRTQSPLEGVEIASVGEQLVGDASKTNTHSPRRTSNFLPVFLRRGGSSRIAWKEQLRLCDLTKRFILAARRGVSLHLVDPQAGTPWLCYFQLDWQVTALRLQWHVSSNNRCFEKCYSLNDIRRVVSGWQIHSLVPSLHPRLVAKCVALEVVEQFGSPSAMSFPSNKQQLTETASLCGDGCLGFLLFCFHNTLAVQLFLEVLIVLRCMQRSV